MIQSGSRKEFYITGEGRRIYSVIVLPEGKGPFPLAIFAHELGSDHSSGMPYAKYLAERGIACCTFDFCGGSRGSNRSDGTSLEMSVLTEVLDIQMVLDAAKSWGFVCKDQIFLIGASQGGTAAALLASSLQNDVRGLVLLYPALIIPDGLHESFQSLDQVPEKVPLFDGWITVGRRYVEDMWDLPLYEKITDYMGPVLLLHGDADNTVPIRYSERAAKGYRNCRFRVIRGGGHGFAGGAFLQASNEIDAWMKQLLNE